MKLNVKGLVFVGFAAAILSANAMAAAGDEKIVTSKAFTEATYQKLSNLTTQGSETGNILSTADAADAKYPSEKAVASAIAASQSATTYTASDGVALSNNNFTNSGIRDVTATDANGANGTITINKNGTTSTVAVKGLKDTAFTETTTTTTLAESAKIPTAGTVKTYVDGQINDLSIGNYELRDNKAESIIDSGEGANASSTTEYASNAAVTGWAQKKLSGTNGQLVTYGATDGTVGSATLGTAALTIKQNNVANATTFGANATEAVTINLATPDWNAASDAAGYIANKPSVEVTGNKVTTITSDSNDTQYPSAAAVYSYVNGLSGSSIPNGSNCSAEAPCALVATGTNTFAWVPMSQPSNN